jgi:UDP-N-acetylmuramoylalanine--D-glutamate ligase
MRRKVIAITGTNGKTTVTSLTGLLCRRAGLSTRVAGNISPAALDVLREAHFLRWRCRRAAAGLGAGAVQLPAAHHLQPEPDAATVLNLTQDHLDWHGSMAAYAADKARIFGASTVRVLNRDDAIVMGMAAPGARMNTFGTGEPDAPEQLRPGERARRAVAGERQSGGRAGKETQEEWRSRSSRSRSR